MISRGGEHQRGMISGAGYPKDKSPDSYMGNKIELNLDRWVTEGNVRFMWVIGATWLAAMGASQHLASVVRVTGPAVEASEAFVGGVRGGPLQSDRVIENLKAKVDAGGMVLVHQDIYPNVASQYSDLVLPAAPWGEQDYARMQGERRLRLYSKIMDPPGEARPDWWIIAQVAQRMGYDGFDWRDSNDVFEEAAERSKGTVHDYAALVAMARPQGKTGHQLLGELGTTGIQCPKTGSWWGPNASIKRVLGPPPGRRFSPRAIGKAWSRFKMTLPPQGDELWVTNMRVNEHWQSQFDDTRIPNRWQRFPVSFLEINPEDAAARDIESGDWVEVENKNVLTQTGGRSAGKFLAAAYVTDQVPPGVTCSYFIFDHVRLDMAANSVTPGQTDPINNRYRYKLGKGTVRKTGSSPYKHTMSFVPRNIT